MTKMLRRIWIQLTADRKRFALLCMVLALGLLLWARLIVVSQPPRTVVANAPLTADNAHTSQNTDPAAVLSDGRVDPRSGRTPLRVELARVPARDPFVISQVHFPNPTPLPSLQEEPDKLRAQPAEELQQVEARLTARLLALAERFKLEAAVGGSMAVINGRPYRANDQVPCIGGEQVQFRLIEIRQRSVILECEGRRFELHMASPGD